MAKDVQRAQAIDEWDYAYRRVESYLHACGVAPRILLTELAVSTIDEARGIASHSSAAKEPPVALAMRVVFSQMTNQFGRVIKLDNGSDEHLRARGRLALATNAAIPDRAKLVFQNLPAAALSVQTLDDRPLQTGPELRLSKLPPAEIEYAFGDTEDAPLVPRRVPVAAMALVMSVVGMMGAAWAATH